MPRVKIIVKTNRNFIPYLGHGPFRRPISVEKDIVDSLVDLGYDITILQNPLPKNPTVVTTVEEETVGTEDFVEETVEDTEETVEDVVEEDIEETVEDAVEETVDEAVEENEEENIEEPNEEDVNEELIVNDPDLSGDSYYTLEFLTTKNVCKQILDNRGVSYPSSATLSNLRDMVIESNPEADFGEDE